MAPDLSLNVMKFLPETLRFAELLREVSGDWEELQ
jgi:hypothetical protein